MNDKAFFKVLYKKPLVTRTQVLASNGLLFNYSLLSTRKSLFPNE